MLRKIGLGIMGLIIVALLWNASSAAPAIYKTDIVYETPDYTESFDWYRGKLRRYDFKVKFIAQEGGDVDLKQGDH